MKKLAFVLLSCAALLPLRADEYIKNGDFQHGSSDWQGDGRSTTQNADPDAAGMVSEVSPDSVHALVVKLKKFDWTKITQDFESKGTTLTVSVTFSFEPGTTLSDKAEDYSNVTHSIDFNAWGPISLKTGTWMIMLSDLSGGRGHTGEYTEVKPRLNSSDSQTLNFVVKNFVNDTTTKTLTLAFPPGKGSVTITHVSVTGTPSAE